MRRSVREAITEIVEKVYEEGNFEGEHRDIHPDRIKPAVEDIISLFTYVVGEEFLRIVLLSHVPEYTVKASRRPLGTDKSDLFRKMTQAVHRAVTARLRG